MIQSGGTTVIGISITACLTTFEQAIKGSNMSGRQFSYLEGLARVTILKFVSDSNTATCEVALLLDRLSNPKFWRTLPISQKINLALQLAVFTCHLPPILDFGSSEEFLELSLYHTAFLWQHLPRSLRNASVEVFIKKRLTVRIAPEGTTTTQKIKQRTWPTIGLKGRDGALKRRSFMFHKKDAVYEFVISALESVLKRS